MIKLQHVVQTMCVLINGVRYSNWQLFGYADQNEYLVLRVSLLLKNMNTFIQI